jgi:hypothetical protein
MVQLGVQGIIHDHVGDVCRVIDIELSIGGQFSRRWK